MSNQGYSNKQINPEELQILNVLSSANKFNNWMYQSIKPYLKGRVLEIGSGIGNITQYALKDSFTVTATDTHDNYCAILMNRFKDDPHLDQVTNIDIAHPNFDLEYAGFLNSFDSIFSLNTIEHVENDKLAILNCRKLLRYNGNLIILVPAYPVLYNHLDRELKHFRRYTKPKLENLFFSSGIKILKTQYFNFMGIFGWWLSGKIFGNKTIPKSQMKLFNNLVPVFKLIDKLILYKAGLSVVIFGKKK